MNWQNRAFFKPSLLESAECVGWGGADFCGIFDYVLFFR